MAEKKEEMMEEVLEDLEKDAAEKQTEEVSEAEETETTEAEASESGEQAEDTEESESEDGQEAPVDGKKGFFKKKKDKKIQTYAKKVLPNFFPEISDFPSFMHSSRTFAILSQLLVVLPLSLPMIRGS